MTEEDARGTPLRGLLRLLSREDRHAVEAAATAAGRATTPKIAELALMRARQIRRVLFITWGVAIVLGVAVAIASPPHALLVVLAATFAPAIPFLPRLRAMSIARRYNESLLNTRGTASIPAIASERRWSQRRIMVGAIAMTVAATILEALLRLAK